MFITGTSDQALTARPQCRLCARSPFPFDAAGQGAAVFNRKIIEIAQRNLNYVFDLAKSLAGAKNLADIVELQAAYWRKQFDALAAQAKEVRVLSTKVAADAGEPFKEQVKRGVDELRKAN
jgi:phasin family protein